MRPHQHMLKHMSSYLTRNLKNRSHTILRLWTEHCEYIAAQKCRRGQQMITLYSRLWDDRALRELFHRFRKQLLRHTKGIVFSAVAVFTYDWDAQRITYDTIRPHLDEIDFVHALKCETLVCRVCKRRRTIDCKVEGIEYCRCTRDELQSHQDANAAKTKKTNFERKFTEWVPYMERKNMVVWRREERPGMYAYKVYASYPDINAEDFLHVQTNTHYRKEWDKTAVTLDIVDIDPNNMRKGHVVYWEMLWPKLFANRDYVYQRRYVIDRTRKIIVIANKSITHPCCPPYSNKQRVQDYWSFMVIKPTTTFKKPGLEYVLTYFDNPGIVVPPAITSWVAQKQMPDFLNKLYMATLAYAEKRVFQDQDDEERHSVTEHIPDPGFEYPPDRNLIGWHEHPDDEDDDDDRSDGRGGSPTRTKPTEELDLTEDTEMTPRKTSWWSYLTPYYYFASS